MGNLSSLAVDTVSSFTVFNYSGVDVIIKSPIYGTVILHDETSLDVSSDSTLIIKDKPIDIWKVRIIYPDPFESQSRVRYKQHTNGSFTLGDYCVYLCCNLLKYGYVIIRMSIPVDDTEDYGDLSKFNVDTGTCTEKTYKYIYNNSNIDVFIFCDCYEGGIKYILRTGQRTKYSGKYRYTGYTSDKSLAIDYVYVWAKNNVLYIERNLYERVKISNKTNDVVTCEKEKGNIMVLPRSYQEIHNVKRIITMNGVSLGYPQKNKAYDMSLDGYFFHIDTREIETVISMRDQ